MTTEDLHRLTDDLLLDWLVELERMKADAEEVLLARLKARRLGEEASKVAAHI